MSAAMGWLDKLLPGREPQTTRLADDFPAELRGGGLALYTGPGLNRLEVLGCEAASRPTAATVRRAHRARRGNRPNPVLADLVQALGYAVEALASGASMLTANGRSQAVAVFCVETDTFESPSSQFYGNSPVAYAFALADQSEVPG